LWSGSAQPNIAINKAAERLEAPVDLFDALAANDFFGLKMTTGHSLRADVQANDSVRDDGRS
jgi:hypothetical protein